MAGPGGTTDLVGHDLYDRLAGLGRARLTAVRSAGKAEHGGDEVAPVQAEQPGAAHHRVAGRGREHLQLSRELGLAVDRAGARRIGLEIGARTAAVVEGCLSTEDIVG